MKEAPHGAVATRSGVRPDQSRRLRYSKRYKMPRFFSLAVRDPSPDRISPGSLARRCLRNSLKFLNSDQACAEPCAALRGMSMSPRETTAPGQEASTLFLPLADLGASGSANAFSKTPAPRVPLRHPGIATPARVSIRHEIHGSFVASDCESRPRQGQPQRSGCNPRIELRSEGRIMADPFDTVPNCGRRVNPSSYPR